MPLYPGIFEKDVGIFLLSGELHYFRVPRKEWRERLSKLKNAGLNTVSTYIPWNWHEVSPGVFDFQGSTLEERDLETFLNYAEEEELGVIAKPGPYICAEWINGGIPGWLLREHSEILARNSRGKPTFWFFKKAPVITCLHPVYLNYTTNWLENVAALLAEHQYTKGGNIIMIQIDNESSYGFHFWPFDTDYNEVVIGTNNEEGLYQQWLREKYKSIEDLNKRYRSGFDSFSMVEPPRSMVKGNHHLAWVFDWIEFKEDMVANFLRKLAEALRRKGINVPLCTNEPYNILPPASISKKSRVVFDTIDLYPQLLNDLESCTEVVNNIERLKAEQTNVAPLALEMQSGWFVSRVPDNTLHLLERLAYIHGLKGVNFYMFSGGVNPKGYGTTDRIYYHDAPLNEKGEETNKYYIVKNFIDFVKSSEIKTKKLSEFVLGYYHPYLYARLINAKSIFSLGYRKLCGFFEKFKEIILKAGFNFESVDLRQASLENLAQLPLLSVFSLDFMEQTVIEKLIKYVEEGGFLFLLPFVPELDENFNGLELMKNILKVKRQKIGRGGWINTGELKLRSPFIVTFDVEGVEPLVFSNGEPCGFQINYGKGSIVQLGFLPNPEYLRFIFEKLDMGSRYCFSSGNILLCERIGDNIGYLLTCNLGWKDQKCDITFSSPSDLDKKILVEEMVVPRRSSIIWTLGLEIEDSKINYITSEISNLEKSDSIIKLECWGYENSPGRVSLTIPEKPKNVSVSSVWDEENKTLLIGYVHGKGKDIVVNAKNKIKIKIRGIRALDEAGKFNQLTYQLKRKIIKKLF
ncbi:MAG: beta-galactosidase [Candidatus Jordarchaeum sp.]|uniref:beta-galactosidase n=1 Tax=Candidatus Jordarchaeum sp. TaxID=2823881 RepID=UPI00404942CD